MIKKAYIIKMGCKINIRNRQVEVNGQPSEIFTRLTNSGIVSIDDAVNVFAATLTDSFLTEYHGSTKDFSIEPVVDGEVRGGKIHITMTNPETGAKFNIASIEEAMHTEGAPVNTIVSNAIIRGQLELDFSNPMLKGKGRDIEAQLSNEFNVKLDIASHETGQFQITTSDSGFQVTDAKPFYENDGVVYDMTEVAEAIDQGRVDEIFENEDAKAEFAIDVGVYEGSGNMAVEPTMEHTEAVKGLLSLAESMGIEVNVLSHITPANGLSIQGTARLFEGVINVVDNENIEETLREEIAHFIVENEWTQGSAHVKEALDLIKEEDYPFAFAQYRKAYGANYQTEAALVQAIKVEILGKLTAQQLGGQQLENKSLWEKIKAFIATFRSRMTITPSVRTRLNELSSYIASNAHNFNINTFNPVHSVMYSLDDDITSKLQAVLDQITTINGIVSSASDIDTGISLVMLGKLVEIQGSSEFVNILDDDFIDSITKLVSEVHGILKPFTAINKVYVSEGMMNQQRVSNGTSKTSFAIIEMLRSLEVVNTALNAIGESVSRASTGSSSNSKITNLHESIKVLGTEMNTVKASIKVNTLAAFTGIAQSVFSRLGLSEEALAYVMRSVQARLKDITLLGRLYGGTVKQKNIHLKLIGRIMGGVRTRTNRRTAIKLKTFLAISKAQKWTTKRYDTIRAHVNGARTSFLLSPYKVAAIEQQLLQKKVELYNHITGLKIENDVQFKLKIKKGEIIPVSKLTIEQQDYYYQKLEEHIASQKVSRYVNVKEVNTSQYSAGASQQIREDQRLRNLIYSRYRSAETGIIDLNDVSDVHRLALQGIKHRSRAAASTVNWLTGEKKVGNALVIAKDLTEYREARQELYEDQKIEFKKEITKFLTENSEDALDALVKGYGQDIEVDERSAIVDFVNAMVRGGARKTGMTSTDYLYDSGIYVVIMDALKNQDSYEQMVESVFSIAVESMTQEEAEAVAKYTGTKVGTAEFTTEFVNLGNAYILDKADNNSSEGSGKALGVIKPLLSRIRALIGNAVSKWTGNISPEITAIFDGFLERIDVGESAGIETGNIHRNEVVNNLLNNLALRMGISRKELDAKFELEDKTPAFVLLEDGNYTSHVIHLAIEERGIEAVIAEVEGSGSPRVQVVDRIVGNIDPKAIYIIKSNEQLTVSEDLNGATLLSTSPIELTGSTYVNLVGNHFITSDNTIASSKVAKLTVTDGAVIMGSRIGELQNNGIVELSGATEIKSYKANDEGVITSSSTGVRIDLGEMVVDSNEDVYISTSINSRIVYTDRKPTVDITDDFKSAYTVRGHLRYSSGGKIKIQTPEGYDLNVRDWVLLLSTMFMDKLSIQEIRQVETEYNVKFGTREFVQFSASYIKALLSNSSRFAKINNLDGILRESLDEFETQNAAASQGVKRIFSSIFKDQGTRLSDNNVVYNEEAFQWMVGNGTFSYKYSTVDEEGTPKTELTYTDSVDKRDVLAFIEAGGQLGYFSLPEQQAIKEYNAAKALYDDIMSAFRAEGTYSVVRASSMSVLLKKKLVTLQNQMDTSYATISNKVYHITQARHIYNWLSSAPEMFLEFETSEILEGLNTLFQQEVRVEDAQDVAQLMSKINRELPIGQAYSSSTKTLTQDYYSDKTRGDELQFLMDNMSHNNLTKLNTLQPNLSALFSYVVAQGRTLTDALRDELQKMAATLPRTKPDGSLYTTAEVEAHSKSYIELFNAYKIKEAQTLVMDYYLESNRDEVVDFLQKTMAGGEMSIQDVIDGLHPDVVYTPHSSSIESTMEVNPKFLDLETTQYKNEYMDQEFFDRFNLNKKEFLRTGEYKTKDGSAFNEDFLMWQRLVDMRRQSLELTNSNKTDIYRLPQMNKSNTNRASRFSLKGLKSWFSDAYKTKDDQEFGTQVGASGTRESISVNPIAYFIKPLLDPNDVSDDLTSSYTHMVEAAIKYQEIIGVIDRILVIRNQFYSQLDSSSLKSDSQLAIAFNDTLNSLIFGQSLDTRTSNNVSSYMIIKGVERLSKTLNLMFSPAIAATAPIASFLFTMTKALQTRSLIDRSQLYKSVLWHPFTARKDKFLRDMNAVDKISQYYELGYMMGSIAVTDAANNAGYNRAARAVDNIFHVLMEVAESISAPMVMRATLDSSKPIDGKLYTRHQAKLAGLKKEYKSAKTMLTLMKMKLKGKDIGIDELVFEDLLEDMSLRLTAVMENTDAKLEAENQPLAKRSLASLTLGHRNWLVVASRANFSANSLDYHSGDWINNIYQIVREQTKHKDEDPILSGQQGITGKNSATSFGVYMILSVLTGGLMAASELDEEEEDWFKAFAHLILTRVLVEFSSSMPLHAMTQYFETIESITVLSGTVKGFIELKMGWGDAAHKQVTKNIKWFDYYHLKKKSNSYAYYNTAALMLASRIGNRNKDRSAFLKAHKAKLEQEALEISALYRYTATAKEKKKILKRLNKESKDLGKIIALEAAGVDLGGGVFDWLGDKAVSIKMHGLEGITKEHDLLDEYMHKTMQIEKTRMFYLNELADDMQFDVEMAELRINNPLMSKYGLLLLRTQFQMETIKEALEAEQKQGGK